MIARQHHQRKVTRGRYVPRFSKQRKITRGGGDTGGTPPPPNIVTLTSFAPTSVAVGTPTTVKLTGTKFQTGDFAPVAIIFKEDAPATGSVVAMTFTVVSDTEIDVPLDFAGNGPDQVMGYSISVGDGHTGSNYVGGFVITGG